MGHDAVSARPAVELIGLAILLDRVDEIVPAPTVQHIHAVAAVEYVTPRASPQIVPTLLTDHAVVTDIPVDDVTIRASPKKVMTPTARDSVLACEPFDCFVAERSQ